MALVARYQPILYKALEGSIDVHRGQSERVSQLLLTHGQLIFLAG